MSPDPRKNHPLPQPRRGSSRRLIDGRWSAASQNTAMAAALVRAQQIANQKIQTLKDNHHDKAKA